MSVGRLSPIFPPVLLPSPYHSPSFPHSIVIMQQYFFFPHSPKIDTCRTCDTFKVQTNNRNKRKVMWTLGPTSFKGKASISGTLEASALSKSDFSIDVITFDLQQSLPTPVLSNNVVFLKRQLWTYTLGIHECKYMYITSFLPPCTSPHSFLRILSLNYNYPSLPSFLSSLSPSLLLGRNQVT